MEATDTLNNNSTLSDMFRDVVTMSVKPGNRAFDSSCIILSSGCA